MAGNRQTYIWKRNKIGNYNKKTIGNYTITSDPN